MERKLGNIFRIAILGVALTTLIATALYPETTAYESNRLPLSDESAVEQSGSVDVQTVLPPTLKRICSCESTGYPDREPRQFESDGSVKRGRINPLDTGMCQINLHYWGDGARSLGFDLFSEEGNKRMALWIYERHGTQPWDWSSACWNN